LVTATAAGAVKTNGAAADIRDLITLDDVADELKYGPNGGLVYCMEYDTPLLHLLVALADTWKTGS